LEKTQYKNHAIPIRALVYSGPVIFEVSEELAPSFAIILSSTPPNAKPETITKISKIRAAVRVNTLLLKNITMTTTATSIVITSASTANVK
jgi:hypothetical protein